MADPNLLIMVGMVFCLAGFVKGMVGLGLPTVSLGLLSIIVDLPTAMALLVMPSLATNVWQALAGGQIGALWRRLWRFLLMRLSIGPRGSWITCRTLVRRVAVWLFIILSYRLSASGIRSFSTK